MITRLVPGGPLERAIMESQQLNVSKSISTQTAGQNMALSDDQLQKLDVCSEQLPLLVNAGNDPSQQVACHLINKPPV